MKLGGLIWAARGIDFTRGFPNILNVVLLPRYRPEKPLGHRISGLHVSVRWDWVDCEVDFRFVPWRRK